MSHSSPYDTQLFSARLVPYRSLQRKHFHVLIMLFCGAIFFISIPFVLLGAWPVAGFMGLDIIALWWAFRANYRSARMYEDIWLTHLELRVDKVSQYGATSGWTFNPAWVRLEKQEHEEYGLEKLLVISRDKGVELGSFLGPDAKARFAGEFAAALGEAKRGPRFS